jgi:hypothetical protein
MATYVHSQEPALAHAAHSLTRVATNSYQPHGRRLLTGSNQCPSTTPHSWPRVVTISQSPQKSRSTETRSDLGGRSRIRTWVGLRRRIYSPSLSTFVTSNCDACRKNRSSGCCVWRSFAQPLQPTAGDLRAVVCVNRTTAGPISPACCRQRRRVDRRTAVARGSSLGSGLTESHGGGHIVHAGPVTTGGRQGHGVDG